MFLKKLNLKYILNFEKIISFVHEIQCRIELFELGYKIQNITHIIC